MGIVNTLELEKEFNRLIDVAYDKGRVEGYNQADKECLIIEADIRREFAEKLKEYSYEVDGYNASSIVIDVESIEQALSEMERE